MDEYETKNFEDGFILLSRSLMNSDIFQNEKWLKVWIWCLSKANHKEKPVPVKRGKGTTVVRVNRGQFIFGRKSASKELKMPASSVRNIVYKLETWQNLDIKSDNQYSIITIRNYDKYQNPENYKRTGKRTAKGQLKDTTNNDNNVNKRIYVQFLQQKFDEFYSLYERHEGKQDAIKAWFQLWGGKCQG